MEQRKKEDDIDWNFWVFVVVSAFLIFGTLHLAHAAPKLPTQKQVPKERCVVRLDNRSVARVEISAKGTVLDFPVKPADVILGRKDSFGIKYVQSDLAISPLGSGATSHLYVYLDGRRFSFDLFTVMNSGCPTISVRDAIDNQVSVDGFFRQKK